MKTMTAMVMGVLFSALPAFAAQSARQDKSGLVVWIFLGFCALIVLAQLVPAVLMMLGLVRGAAGERALSPQKVESKS